jgi:hypothetical protein
MPREKLGLVEDPANPVHRVHVERWQERAGYGDGGKGVPEVGLARVCRFR